MRNKLLELITTIWAFALLTPVSAQQHIYQDPTYAQVDSLIAVAAGKTPPTPTYQQLYMHPTYEQVDRLITTVKDGREEVQNVLVKATNEYALVNSEVAAITNRVALLESSKADNTALTAHVTNTNNPHAVTAAQVGAVGIGERIEFTQAMGEGLTAEAWFDPFLLALSNPNFGTAYHHGGYSTYYSAYHPNSSVQIGAPVGISNYDGLGVFISDWSTTKYLHHTIEQWNQDGSLYTLMYFPEGQQGMLALQNWQSLSAMLDSTNATTLATNPTFSNAVLAVNVDFATNTTGAAYVAVTNALAGFGFDADALAELPGGKVYGSIGGLLAALAAAVAWLKKNKVQTLKLNDNSVETSADGGVAKLDDFFTESNSLLTGTIAAKSIPAFSSSSTYEVGEIVVYDGVAYKCVTAITTAEEWTAAHWTLATNSDLAARLKGLKSDGTATDAFATDLLGKQVAKDAIDAEIIEKGTAPDAHLEASTDEQRLKLVLADNSVAYDSAKALPYKLTSVIGDRVIATMTLTAASTDITLPTISANDTTVKDFILDVTNAYAVEGVATDAGINIPRTDFKLVTRDGESLTDVTTVKAGKSAFICFTQKSPVVDDGTTYPCWCVTQLPFGDPS